MLNDMAYQIQGFVLRQLCEADKAPMMALQDAVLRALPNPLWYYPSEEWEFDSWLAGREAFGYMRAGALAGFAVLTPAGVRGEHAYALKLGESPINTFDFHDVMVLPPYRGRGMHTCFLRLFDAMARAMDGRAVYATVDPDNAASLRNFERAGYVCVAEKPAYDGRARRFYKLTLR